MSAVLERVVVWRHRVILAAHRGLDRLDGTTTVHAGRVIRYDWKYLDHAGHDVTSQVKGAGMVAAVAEAVAKDGTVLLRVRSRGEGWQIAVDGGELGEQVDGLSLATIHGSPFDAMQATARRLRFVAQER